MEQVNKWATLPFINISAENLDLASDMLSREEKGELMEMIIDFIRNGKEPESDKRHVNAVFNQFRLVIERKSKSYFGRKEHMDDVNAKKQQEKEVEQPKQIQQPTEKKEVVTKTNNNGLEEWLILVDRRDSLQFFLDTYKNYFSDLDEAKHVVNKYMLSKNKHVSWLR